jgi:hypothetical protein
MTTSVSARTSGTINPTRQQLDELDALLQRMLELPVNKREDAEPTEKAAEPAPPPVQPREKRPAAQPMSYMVVETASPRPLPPASGFEPRPSMLSPRLVPVTPLQEQVEDEPDELVLPPAPPSGEATSQTPPAKDETWVPLRSTWHPSAQTWQPLADSWHQANGAPAPGALPSPIPSPHLDFTPPREIMDTVPLALPPAPAAIESVQAEEPVVVAEPKLRLSVEDAPVAESRLLLPLLWFNQGFDACLAPLGAPGQWLCGVRGRQTLGIVGLTCLAAAIAIAVSAGMGWTW